MGLALCLVGWFLVFLLLLAFLLRPASENRGAVNYNHHNNNHTNQIYAPLPLNLREMVERLPGTRDLRKRRALIFGLDYEGKDYELFGCINDAHDMRQLLVSHYGFTEILLMTDRTKVRPTRGNMLAAMNWLVEGAQEGDSLVLHYSGHGDLHVSAGSSRKRGGYDDAIVPLDWETNGQILDDTLYQHLVVPLRGRACLTAIFDSCHSGTGLDLKFNFRVNSRTRQLLAMPPDVRASIDADVVLYSASLEGQTADDAVDEETGRAYGALTNALITTLARNDYQISCGALLIQMDAVINRTSLQRPQMSSERKLNPSAPFTFLCNATQRSV